MKKGRFLFLGTGASAGVPVVACSCPVCLSTNPKNKRMRPSALLSIDEKKILIDVGPDFRMQAINNKIDKIDGVLVTHTHYDHVAGIDELRAFYLLHNRSVPLLASKESIEELRLRYHYLFAPKKSKGLAAQIEFQELEGERGELLFQGIALRYTSYFQAAMKVNGFRFGSLAYISDIYDYPPTIFEDLRGVEILIVSALRNTLSPVHFTFDEAVAFAERVGARQTYFTHISHESDHDEIEARLPPEVRLAYDGLELELRIDNGS